MKLALVGLATLALAGCDVQRGPITPAESYLRIRDRVTASLGIDWMFPSCESVVGGSLRVERCYRMTPPQRWSGVWADEFEGSRFCPGATDRCPYQQDGNTWLEWSRPAPSNIKSDGYTPRVYRMTFIGRRTAVPGAYGHMRGSRHYILVDRLIQAELLREGSEQAGPGSNPG